MHASIIWRRHASEMTELIKGFVGSWGGPPRRVTLPPRAPENPETAKPRSRDFGVSASEAGDCVFYGWTTPTRAASVPFLDIPKVTPPMMWRRHASMMTGMINGL